MQWQSVTKHPSEDKPHIQMRFLKSNLNSYKFTVHVAYFKSTNASQSGVHSDAHIQHHRGIE